MQRVLVIGCPGSGKSTFARRLRDITGLPLVHLDLLYWNPDGTTSPRSLFLGRLEEVLRGESWIIDGNYAFSMERRLQRCDAAFFLDYPTELCLESVRARRGRPRRDMPCATLEDGDAEFMESIRSYAAQQRPGVLALLRQYGDGREIHIFKDRAEADAYLARLECNEGRRAT